MKQPKVSELDLFRASYDDDKDGIEIRLSRIENDLATLTESNGQVLTQHQNDIHELYDDLHFPRKKKNLDDYVWIGILIVYVVLVIVYLLKKSTNVSTGRTFK